MTEKQLDLFDSDLEDTDDETTAPEVAYTFFATADMDSYGFIDNEGFPVKPDLLDDESLYFIYQLAVMGKELRQNTIRSLTEQQLGFVEEERKIILTH